MIIYFTVNKSHKKTRTNKKSTLDTHTSIELHYLKKIYIYIKTTSVSHTVALNGIFLHYNL